MDSTYLVEEPFCVAVIEIKGWGHQMSNTKNIVHTVSQIRNDGYFMYSVYGFASFDRLAPLFSVVVKGYLRSPQIKI